MFSVSALGELLIDFTEAGYTKGGMRLFEQNPGGAPANVLVALEHLGHKTAFLGKVGDDMHGVFLRETLASEGVDISGLVCDPNIFTTLAFVALDASGERTFSFARKPGADTQLKADELALDVIGASRVFHVGSLSLTDEPARSATIAALEAAREAGCTLSYDPNYRASLWNSVDAATQQMRSLVSRMDLVKISDEECGLLTDTDNPEAAARFLLAQGPSVVCVTLGGEGALVACEEGCTHVPAFACELVDTTGAGDSFWGGFLAAFCESGRAADEVDLNAAAEFARFGNAVASLCVQGRGGIPSMPSREAVLERLGN